MDPEGVLRRSPVELGEPAETREINGFAVAWEYPGPAGATRLVDLSHCPKWDLQDGQVERLRPWGLAVPEAPGGVVLEGGALVARLNRTQCSLWRLDGEPAPPLEEPACTELTDGLALLAVAGPAALEVMERVCNLDLAAPGLEPPALLQGPLMHLPAQVCLARRGPDRAVVLLAVSRGYGRTLARAILHAGSEAGLAPGGLGQLGLAGASR
jgi:hypothetical protein